ncbi:MAG: helix-turn-helix transcriptional regulator [Varibaculum cambriense]|uniref:helix-turn-helix domain-containing protein n=1 Tax=Varibaculum cambriense TaxID=184870 RepID=UPI00241D6819|nr:helix-turn-helix transcriptional regulator [Varibaculum cambriense]MBS6620519.1 helix-turn-helix transcriptional regulator [Varibaculum cambriense]
MSRLNRSRFKGFEIALSSEIQAELARQKKTIGALADEMKYRRATLSAKLNGHTPFTGAEIGKIAQCLNIAASELMRRAEETVNPTCPTAHALRQTPAPTTPTTPTITTHPKTSPKTTPSDPGVLADEAEAGMWQAVLDHKAHCPACDTLLQAQTHLTELALSEEEQRYIRHLRYLARVDAASRDVEVA